MTWGNLWCSHSCSATGLNGIFSNNLDLKKVRKEPLEYFFAANSGRVFYFIILSFFVSFLFAMTFLLYLPLYISLLFLYFIFMLRYVSDASNHSSTTSCVHPNPTAAEDSPVHPTQVEIAILIPHEGFVSMSLMHPSASAIYVAFFTWGITMSHSKLISAF